MAAFFPANDRDGAESIPKEYDMIVKHIRETCKQIAGDKKKQVIVLQTAGNKLYKAIVDLSYDAEASEQAFLNKLGKNDIIIRLVCCWADGTFDVPSYRFRKKLCELNPENENAQMLLCGDCIFDIKSIKDTVL